MPLIDTHRNAGSARARVGERSPAGLGSRADFDYIRSSILVEFCDLASALGLDPLGLMVEAGISPSFLLDRDLMVPMAAIVSLYEITAHHSGAHDFGMRLAEARGLPDLGAIMLLLRQERTVGQAINTLSHVLHKHSSAVYAFLDTATDNPTIVINILGRQIEQCRQAMETSVASITRILRWMLGETWQPFAVCFTHAQLGAIDRHRKFFKCSVEFEQDVNGIVLSVGDLNRHLPPSMPLPSQYFSRRGSSPLLSARELGVYRITRLIAMDLTEGRSTAPDLARRLGITVRTLSRRLAGAGTTYSTVRDAVRRQCATQYLRNTDRPLTEVANLVGFASLSAFSRWFRGAFDANPSAWREASQAYHPGPHFR